MDLCLTGRMMDAEEAERAGLVAACRGRRAGRGSDESGGNVAGYSKLSTVVAKDAVGRAQDMGVTEVFRLNGGCLPGCSRLKIRRRHGCVHGKATAGVEARSLRHWFRFFGGEWVAGSIDAARLKSPRSQTDRPRCTRPDVFCLWSARRCARRAARSGLISRNLFELTLARARRSFHQELQHAQVRRRLSARVTRDALARTAEGRDGRRNLFDKRSRRSRVEARVKCPPPSGLTLARGVPALLDTPFAAARVRPVARLAGAPTISDRPNYGAIPLS